MEDTIELVIKLPKGIYVASQMLNVKPDDVIQIPLEVIANGTPLPKGHGGLKDENYFLNILQCEEYKTCTWRNCSECNREKSIKRRTVLEAPTIVEADRS